MGSLSGKAATICGLDSRPELNCHCGILLENNPVSHRFRFSPFGWQQPKTSIELEILRFEEGCDDDIAGFNENDL